MKEKALRLDWKYLAKVLGGLLLLGAITFAGWMPAWPGLTPPLRFTLLVMAALAFAAGIPLAARLYRRQDEFHRFVHHSASVSTLPLLVALFGIMGSLQAADMLPPLNQSVSMLLIVALWGVQLMWADRKTR
jgi:hypothetical protein